MLIKSDLNRKRSQYLSCAVPALLSQLACVCSMFALFNPVSQIFGLGHSTQLFVAYNLIVAGISYLLFIHDYATNGFSKSTIAVLIGLLAVSLVAVVTLLLRGYSGSGVTEACVFFIIYALSGFCVGCYMSKWQRFNFLIKWFDIIALILLACSASYALSDVANLGTTDSGVGHQEGSYSAAVAFGIYGIMIINGYEQYRFRFALSHPYQLLQYVFAAVSLAMAFAGGGRGGMVLVFVYLGWFVWLSSKGKSQIRCRFTSLLLVSLALFGLYFCFGDISSIQRGINKLLELFSSGALTDTSNAATNSISSRNVLRDKALALILQSPLVGHGLFQYIDVAGFYPHNFFLEVALQKGLIGEVFAVLAIVLFAKKWQMIMRVSDPQYILVVLLLYVSVMFLFSGSYMSSSVFWVLVGYVVSRCP